eukprot:GHVS01032238.1.p1 GENE.GHVS01032238.1~~GHVS01032238.1.p1  ORF type:complete len:122 (+),score=39.02 GHVS01032238.1:77-442(+)
MSSVPTSELTEEAKQELLCTYAALILHDESLEISQANMSKLITASENTVEPYMPILFARALQGKDIGQLLTASGSVGGGGGGAPAAGGGGAAAAPEAAKKEEKEEEVEEEEEDDLGFSLFD